jgi:hypothetical protein
MTVLRYGSTAEARLRRLGPQALRHNKRRAVLAGGSLHQTSAAVRRKESTTRRHDCTGHGVRFVRCAQTSPRKTC